MDLPPKSDYGIGLLLAIAAAFVTTITGLWRGWFGARKDLRADRHGAREDQSDRVAHDVKDATVILLRGEVARLSAAMDAMSVRLDVTMQRLDAETQRRYKAESDAAELRLRVSVLEAELSELRGDPA